MPKPTRPSQSPTPNTRMAALLAAPSAVFRWRQGVWHVHVAGQAQALPAALGQAVEAMRDKGLLVQTAPGQFTRSAHNPPPLLNDAESPLARLAAMRGSDGEALLDQAQHGAGERLRADYERALLSPRVTTAYEQPGGSGGRHWQMSDNGLARLTDGAIAARQRVHAALDAVGPELAHILFQVCCLASGIEQAELRLGLPRRAGKAVLLLALTRLARHYGLKPPLRHAGPGRIGAWSTDDSRPAIMPAAPHPP